ncbi:rubrerythrin family protein [candidate division KSB1 bacterium]|nr:rubrerythrin family protein [candidate division KSB1 bacterium]
MIDDSIKKQIVEFQKDEITEHFIYKKLAKRVEGKNREVLEKISDDELRHYNKWKEYTNTEVKPCKFTIRRYMSIARIMGITFAIKMMEHGEENAIGVYREIAKDIPEAMQIHEDEVEHEEMLVEMINEQRIEYIGSMVLGLNDALVELTGALAGFTFALQNAKTIGVAGFITGIAASLSMAASEYLSKKSEEGSKDPLKASFYTGMAYIFTVLFLIFPYFLFANHFIALGIMLFNALLVIYFFSFFVSVVKNKSFKLLFGEMLAISFGVAIISFVVGWIARSVFNLEI